MALLEPSENIISIASATFLESFFNFSSSGFLNSPRRKLSTAFSPFGLRILPDGVEDAIPILILKNSFDFNFLITELVPSL